MTKKITTLFIASCLSMFSFAQINLQNGLIAYYTMDNTLLDTTTNNLDLFSGGSPQAATDRFGAANAAYQLSSFNPDYFTGSYNAIMAPAELTLAAWINLSDPFNDQKIAGKTSVGPGYLMGVDSNKLDAEIWDATNFHMRIKSGNISANTWNHVAISYKANGYLKIYINGMPVDSVAASAEGVGTNTGNAFCIGGAPWDNFALNMNGAIDDVCLYGRQLSDAEIAELNALTPTSLKQLLHVFSGLTMYPNPVSNGVVNLSFNTPKQELTQITITDVTGKVVYTDKKNSLNSVTITVNDLADGMYLLQVVEQDATIKTERLMIRRK